MAIDSPSSGWGGLQRGIVKPKWGHWICHLAATTLARAHRRTLLTVKPVIVDLFPEPEKRLSGSAFEMSNRSPSLQACKVSGSVLLSSRPRRSYSRVAGTPPFLIILKRDPPAWSGRACPRAHASVSPRMGHFMLSIICFIKQEVQELARGLSGLSETSAPPGFLRGTRRRRSCTRRCKKGWSGSQATAAITPLPDERKTREPERSLLYLAPKDAPEAE